METETSLIEKYPALLLGHADAPGANGVGLACGKGWYGLLDRLFARLSTLLEELPELPNKPQLYEVGVAKNRLRILLRPMTPEMATYVYETMTLSETVCENCSAPKPAGESTLCAACAG